MLIDKLPSHSWEDIVFVCVGTDRSTGDSLGPLVGTRLEQLGYAVHGTLHNPVHAANLEDRLGDLPKDKIIIAIDASLGKSSSIGKIHLHKGPLRPGAGVGKELPTVGDYHIVGIVNVGGFMEYFVLQNTKLSLIHDMVDEIVDIIQRTYPIHKPFFNYRVSLKRQLQSWLSAKLNV